MKLIIACFSILLLTSSCVDIFDELILHTDGTGTYKYSINLSASKVKINSVLALDSLEGKRIPKIPEIKERIAEYVTKLEGKSGISNVQADCNYTDFVFKFSCDFTSVSALQTAIREVIAEESKGRSKVDVSENWITLEGNMLIRTVPGFESPLNKLKGEDQEALKNGKYIVVTRFDKPVMKSENTAAKISPSKTAVLLQTSPYAVALNPSVLKNVITVTP